jgi:hypothetical protein
MTFKALYECLKLHLPALFISTTLFTRGYFLILFENEGVISTRKLTTVEWSGLSLSFSRYTPNLDANAQGAKVLLTHTIKVQFLDLHEQFRNVKALTIMASKLGKVLDIEATDSYIKRPAGPMVTIEVRDITKLVGYIRIPSKAKGASATNTICQRILYSNLLNQCRKCRKFMHQARMCTTSKNKIQEEPSHHDTHPSTNPRGHPSSHPPPQDATRQSKWGSHQKATTAPPTEESSQARTGSKNPAKTPSAQAQPAGTFQKSSEN